MSKKNGERELKRRKKGRNIFSNNILLGVVMKRWHSNKKCSYKKELTIESINSAIRLNEVKYHTHQIRYCQLRSAWKETSFNYPLGAPDAPRTRASAELSPPTPVSATNVSQYFAVFFSLGDS